MIIWQSELHGNREGETEWDIFHPLVHSEDGCKDQGGARLSLTALLGSHTWVQGSEHLGHLPLLSGALKRTGIGSAATGTQTDARMVAIFSGIGFSSYAVMLVPIANTSENDVEHLHLPEFLEEKLKQYFTICRFSHFVAGQVDRM